MLVCSLSLEYKYLNISKVIQVPTSILGKGEEARGEEGKRNRGGEEWE